MYNQFKIASDKKEASAIAFAITSVICALLWRFDVSQCIHADSATRDYVNDILLLLCFVNLAGAIKGFIESFVLQVRAWRAKSKEAK